MKITIVRHGETEENTKGICQGHIPGKLSELGKEQARKLAERLKIKEIDVIFSSDLARASDTAKEIIKFHSKVKMHLTKELRERYQGTLQGKSKEDVERWEKEENRDKIAEEAGAEKIEEMVQRADRFIKKLSKEFEEENVLLVGHGGINWAIISNFLNEPWAEIWKKDKPKNTSVTIFELDKNNSPKLNLMNCIKHLD